MRKKQKQEAPPPVTARQFYSSKEKTLSCSHQETLMNLTGMNKLKSVQKMIVQNCPNIRTFKGCDQLDAVKYIDFSGSPVENTDALSNYRKLQQFICQNCSLESIDGLSQNFALQILDLRGNRLEQLDSIETIKNFKCLKELWLKDNPVEQAEGYREYLSNILPTSLQKLNGEPLDEELRNEIISKRQARRPQLFKRPATAGRASRFQNLFLEEIKAYQRQNEGNIQYIGYLSKRVNYVTSVAGASCNYTTEMLDMNSDELLLAFKSRPLVINDEKLFLVDYDGRSTYKLQNKANFFVQIAYVLTSALASKEALIIGQLSKQHAINTYELQTRLLDLYESSSQLQVGPGTLNFRRRENDYETHIVVFVRAAPVTEAPLLPESPISLLKDFAALQASLRTISVNTSFDLVLEDFDADVVQCKYLLEWNIMDERDAEAGMWFDFQERVQALVVRRGAVLVQGDYEMVKEYLMKDMEIKDDELDLSGFRIPDDENANYNDYSKDYTYEYSYVDEEEPEPEASVQENEADPENQEENKEKEEDQEQRVESQQEKDANQQSVRYAYAD